MFKVTILRLLPAICLITGCTTEKPVVVEPWPKSCTVIYTTLPFDNCPLNLHPHRLYSDGLGKIREEYDEVVSKGGGLIEPDFSNGIRTLNVDVFDLQKNEHLAWLEGERAAHVFSREKIPSAERDAIKSRYFYDAYSRKNLADYKVLGEKEIAGRHCIGYSTEHIQKKEKEVPDSPTQRLYLRTKRLLDATNPSRHEYEENWIVSEPGYQGIVIKKTNRNYAKLCDEAASFSAGHPSDSIFNPPSDYEQSL